MILATTLSGLFMFAVNLVANRMDPGEFTVFRTLLTVYLLMSFPSTGLQVIFTHQTAAALASPERQSELAATVAGVLRAAFLFWLVVALSVYPRCACPFCAVCCRARRILPAWAGWRFWTGPAGLWRCWSSSAWAGNRRER